MTICVDNLQLTCSVFHLFDLTVSNTPKWVIAMILRIRIDLANGLGKLKEHEKLAQGCSPSHGRARLQTQAARRWGSGSQWLCEAACPLSCLGASGTEVCYPSVWLENILLWGRFLMVVSIWISVCPQQISLAFLPSHPWLAKLI